MYSPANSAQRDLTLQRLILEGMDAHDAYYQIWEHYPRSKETEYCLRKLEADRDEMSEAEREKEIKELLEVVRQLDAGEIDE